MLCLVSVDILTGAAKHCRNCVTAASPACSQVWALHQSVIWWLQNLESCSKHVAALEKEVAALKLAKTALHQVVTTCSLCLLPPEMYSHVVLFRDV